MEARDDAGAAAVFASERAGAGSELSVLCHVFLYHARHFSDDAVRARKPGPLLYGAAAHQETLESTIVVLPALLMVLGFLPTICRGLNRLSGYMNLQNCYLFVSVARRKL